MQRSRNTFPVKLIYVALLALALVLWGCGDDDEGGNGNGSDTGADVTSDMGTPDQTADQGTPDQSGVCETVNDQCSTPLPSSNPNPRVMIEQINLRDDYVILKNVNTEDANLDGWFVCQAPNYQALPSGITLRPSDTIRVNLGASGTDTADEIFIAGANGLTQEDEIAFYSSNQDNFSNPDFIEVYLRWGSATTSGRSSEADAAGLWSQGTFVPVCGDNIGIIAVGDGTLPTGFRDVPASCF